MDGKRRLLVAEILKNSEAIFNIIKPHIPLECLSSDITIAQLRVMMIMYTDGPSKMSAIAGQLEVSLPSVTGIMDNLVKKNLATRETDESDRRVVICSLTADGEKLLGSLWTMGQGGMGKLLEGLGDEQLEKSAEVAGFLLDNIKKTSGLKPTEG